MSATQRSFLIALAVLGAVCGVYSNHFRNGFHFDDWHTVTQNPAIHDLLNVPRFFTDSRTMSVLPANQVYRPVVTTSLAIDYWVGGGLNPIAFHASTFFWFLVLLGCMFSLFRKILGGSIATALFATAWFGLHPVSAETMNYIIQRADLYVALGVVSGLALYAAFPHLRRWGLYLAPVFIAGLCKPTALIFPALLIAYVLLIEQERFGVAIRRALPSMGIVALLALLHRKMTPPSFAPSSSSWYEYVITQPRVTLHYFCSWLAPVGLSADTDRKAFLSLWSVEALAGFAFVIALAALGIWCSRNLEFRPIAFGLFWFLIALVPTAAMPLAEVENDHRMFLPVIGLSLAVTYAGLLACRWLYSRQLAYLARPARIVACLGALGIYGVGTYARNEVWLNEETLWYDVTQKSPRNGRGLMNYGITQMEKGRYDRALEYFDRAKQYTPFYPYLYINLGIAREALNQHAIAEQHFRKAIDLAGSDAQPRFYYGRYLMNRGRIAESAGQLQAAVDRNPMHTEARALLARMNERARTMETPERYLGLSLESFQRGRYKDCIEAARKALSLRPDYAEAYNNIAAGHQALGEWDEAIAAAREAIRLRPDFQLARNNLAWSLRQQALDKRTVQTARRM
jgi:tetratricopeptide (TPR) repeat protein